MQSSRSYRDRAEADIGEDQELELLTRSEHLRVIFQHALLILLSNLSAGIVLTVGIWPTVPQYQISVWLSLLILFNGARWIIGRRLANAPIEPNDLPKHEILLLGSTFGSGLLWGAAAALFYVPDEPASNLFLALILVAMTAASAVLLSFHRLAFPVFCIPAIVPLTVHLIADPGTLQTTVALVIPIYYAFLLLLSRQIYRYTHTAIGNGLLRERQALMDHLTAIPNRRAFEEFLEQEWMRAIRLKHPIALIMSDIDDFKLYNDRYGHAVGDAILRSTAGLFLQAARRRTDLAARIGGDEFAIIVPGTNDDGLTKIIENIEESRKRLSNSTFDQWSFPTLSFGYHVTTPGVADSAFELFEQADNSLYQAKAARKSSARTLTN